MFRTYFKAAWRNKFRNRTTTLINLLGLSVALAAFVLIALWVQNELSFDHYHKNAKDIFLVQTKFDQSNPVGSITPLPLGDALRKVPDVKYVARMAWWGGTLNVGGNLYDAPSGIAVDSDWFKIFDHPVLRGDIRSFNSHPFSIVFTESRAKQLFGDKDPIGRVVKLDTSLYQVAAVIKDNPINSSFQFDMLVPMTARLAFRKWDNGNWSNSSYRTFVEVFPNTNLVAFMKNATAYTNELSGVKGCSLLLQELKELHFDTESTDPFFRRGSHSAVFVFSMLAILLLISASINYVNLSITEANARTKEISVRKIIGGSSVHLFLQFLLESFLLCMISLVLAIFIMWLTLPFFNTLTETNFRLSGESGALWLFLLGTLVVCTLLTGILPALTMAFFKPLNFLRGYSILKFKSLSLRKGLVVFQFTIGVMFIVGTIVIFRQMQLARASAAQYDREQVVSLVLPSQVMQKSGDDQKSVNRFSKTLENDLRRQGAIEEVAFASTSIEGAMNSNGILGWYWDGMDTSVHLSIKNITVEAGAENIFNLRIKEGRWFRKDGTDKKNFILNETAVREFGLREPVVGQVFGKRGQDTGRIVGIINDYTFSSLYNKIDPLVLMNNDDDYRPMIFVKISSGRVQEAMSALSAVWKRDIPEAPFEYQFMDQAFDKLYKSDLKISKLVLIFSCVSILISVLGLFGLAAFVAEQRRKEIGIRKVMGAAVIQITAMLSGEFLALVAVAVVIASPIAYWGINKWLQNFNYRTNVSWWIFVAAGVIVLLISMVTVSFHAIRAAMANPVKTLRKE